MQIDVQQQCWHPCGAHYRAISKGTPRQCVSVRSPTPVGGDGCHFNTLRPRQDGRLFPDDIFKSIIVNENVQILIKTSLMFVPKAPINNIPALVQIVAWRRPGDKPLSEPMMVNLLTHICVSRPQWVNAQSREEGQSHKQLFRNNCRNFKMKIRVTRPSRSAQVKKVKLHIILVRSKITSWAANNCFSL